MAYSDFPTSAEVGFGSLSDPCHAFHESVMRFKADIGQALLTNSDVSTRPRPSGWADVE
jgi:hypothetical protein